MFGKPAVRQEVGELIAGKLRPTDEQIAQIGTWVDMQSSARYLFSKILCDVRCCVERR
jgi:hypothetical protein